MNARLKKLLRWILVPLLGILILLQIFQIDKTNPEYDPSGDFMTIHQPSDEVKGILKVACYDCHSFETRYPWYTNIQPIGWWIEDHIEEGRSELNFSQWASYEYRRKDHKLEEVVEEVEEGKMPLDSYLITHADARLSPEQEKLFLDWIKEVRASLVDPNAETETEEEAEVEPETEEAGEEEQQ